MMMLEFCLGGRAAGPVSGRISSVPAFTRMFLYSSDPPPLIPHSVCHRSWVRWQRCSHTAPMCGSCWPRTSHGEIQMFGLRMESLSQAGSLYQVGVHKLCSVSCGATYQLVLSRICTADDKISSNVSCSNEQVQDVRKLRYMALLVIYLSPLSSLDILNMKCEF